MVTKIQRIGIIDAQPIEEAREASERAELHAEAEMAMAEVRRAVMARLFDMEPKHYMDARAVLGV